MMLPWSASILQCINFHKDSVIHIVSKREFSFAASIEFPHFVHNYNGTMFVFRVLCSIELIYDLQILDNTQCAWSYWERQDTY